MEETSKKVKDSIVETVHIIRPSDLNSAGRLYGGILMQWIDEVAALVAMRHAQMSVTTASVDNLKFLRGAYLKDVIVIIGRATYVGNTSMEVRVDTFVEPTGGQREQINRAFLTLVGLDESNRPSRLPRLVPESDEEILDWGHANKRREMRQAQRKEGFHFFP